FWERGGLWGLVLGIELVLCVTAALSLWLGHLKGRVAQPLSCHASSRQ
ncbi:MFS transporter, partial [Aeromonas media]